jgi:hypothetical protein
MGVLGHGKLEGEHEKQGQPQHLSEFEKESDLGMGVVGLAEMVLIEVDLRLRSEGDTFRHPHRGCDFDPWRKNSANLQGWGVVCYG